MKKFYAWVIEQLSDGIEKTTVGAWTMFGSFCCIIYLTIRYGAVEIVESLLTTAMIISATLMGVNSLADIFKVNKTATKATDGTVTYEVQTSKNQEN